MKKFETDTDVEAAISALQDSPLVKLAMKEKQVKYRRRQYLYQLRYYEKRGRDLQEAGITEEMLEGGEYFESV